MRLSVVRRERLGGFTTEKLRDFGTIQKEHHALAVLMDGEGVWIDDRW